MQILKALIVIMGVLIIAGFTFLGVELYRRANDPDRRAEAAADRAPAPGRPTEEVGLDLPNGARMGDPVVAGNRVLFRVTVPDGADRLYVIDPRSGAVTASVTTGKAGTPR